MTNEPQARSRLFLDHTLRCWVRDHSSCSKLELGAAYYPASGVGGPFSCSLPTPS
jgi:hypothetical protein